MKPMNDRQKNVAQYCDGVLTSQEVAILAEDNPKYVQRTMLYFDLPRLRQAPRTGKNNPSYVSGRKIDRDGYVLVSAPLGHPHARMRKGRRYGMILEHRLIMEHKLGRYLEPTEIVDHIDGLRLHNSPDNLRLFSSNAEHLKATITGKIPDWSKKGFAVMTLAVHRREDQKLVNTYHQKKVHGDARLTQILLLALQLGKDSPFLSGSSRLIKKAGIDLSDRSMIQRELQKLSDLYA